MPRHKPGTFMCPLGATGDSPQPRYKILQSLRGINPVTGRGMRVYKMVRVGTNPPQVIVKTQEDVDKELDVLVFVDDLLCEAPLEERCAICEQHKSKHTSNTAHQFI